MDVLLGNGGSLVTSPPAVQRIYPEVSFKCSGSIQSWVFGGQWEGEQWDGSIYWPVHRVTDMEAWQ